MTRLGPPCQDKTRPACDCGCGRTIENPKPTQRFYSDACRAAGWRREHLTLRCPHCEKPVHAILLTDNDGRSNGQEGP